MFQMQITVILKPSAALIKKLDIVLKHLRIESTMYGTRFMNMSGICRTFVKLFFIKVFLSRYNFQYLKPKYLNIDHKYLFILVSWH